MKEACGSNSYPIVKLMLDSDSDLCATPIGVAACKAALMEVRRQQLNVSEGMDFRPLMELLSRAIEAAAGAATDETREILDAVTRTSSEGDALLRSGDFAGAARNFKASVEHCESALAVCTGADAIAAWKQRFVMGCGVPEARRVENGRVLLQ